MKKITIFCIYLLLIYSLRAIGEPLIALGNVNVRLSPPSGLFCSRGDQIGVIKKGDIVNKIEDVKAYCGLFFYYDYYKIEFKDKNGLTHQAYISKVDQDGTKLFSEVK